MHARARALPDNQVHAKIFHGRIQNFLERGLQAMDLVQKKEIARVQRSQHRRHVAFFLQQRPGRDLDRRAHFVRQNLRQCCFPQPRRPVQQNVVQRFPAVFRRIHCDFQVFLHAPLPDKILDTLRTDARLNPRVLCERFSRNNPVSSFRHLLLHLTPFDHFLRSGIYSSRPTRAAFFIAGPPRI